MGLNGWEVLETYAYVPERISRSSLTIQDAGIGLLFGGATFNIAQDEMYELDI